MIRIEGIAVVTERIATSIRSARAVESSQPVFEQGGKRKRLAVACLIARLRRSLSYVPVLTY